MCPRCTLTGPSIRSTGYNNILRHQWGYQTHRKIAYTTALWHIQCSFLYLRFRGISHRLCALHTMLTLLFCLIWIMYTYLRIWIWFSVSVESCTSTSMLGSRMLTGWNQRSIASVHLTWTIKWTIHIALLTSLSNSLIEASHSFFFRLFMSLKIWQLYSLIYTSKIYGVVRNVFYTSYRLKPLSYVMTALKDPINYHFKAMHPVISLPKISIIASSISRATCRSSHCIRQISEVCIMTISLWYYTLVEHDNISSAATRLT